MSPKRAVKIRNPLDGPGWTSAKQAVKFLTRGQARLVGTNEIEFIASDYRASCAERSMTTTTEPARPAPPTRRAALQVVPEYGDWSPLTFAPYPENHDFFCY